jgi:hypothetical protein
MEAYTEMFKYVGSYLNTVEEVQPPPLHSQLGESWWGSTTKEWDMYLKDGDCSEEMVKKAREVLDCFQIGYTCLAKAANCKEQDEIETKIQELLLKPQSVQRTEEWYREMRQVLSASEFYQLFGPPRGRGQLVMSKVQLPEAMEEQSASQRKCCLTMEMTPMDWGIRFEPVAKQFLEAKWKASIAEMGRLHHPSRKGLAASPDGLIQNSAQIELIGDLVEIKCPSSRPIGKLIPPSYWYQMQLQLEVTQRHVCQYCEFNFRSFTAQKPETCEPPAEPCEKGLIYVLQNEELATMKYEYGPLGNMEWVPELMEGWEVVERIPWYLEKYWIQPVARDEAWFQSILPLIDHFWEDVEKARKGDFAVPESSVKKKAVICAIVD